MRSTSLFEQKKTMMITVMKLRLPLSNFKKNKTIDTPKIVNILFNVSTRLQSSSGMTLLRNAERYIYKLSGSNYSEVHKHIMSCEHFQYYQTLLNLPNTLLAQFDPHTTEAIIYQNCVILDKSRHWSLLLYKESLHIYLFYIQKPELNHGTRASKELVIFN